MHLSMIDRCKYSVDQTLRYLEVYFIVRLNSENSSDFFGIQPNYKSIQKT